MEDILEDDMHTKTTAHYGSSGVAASIVAYGNESEIQAWADKKRAQGYQVTVEPPSRNREEWLANAQLSGDRAAELQAAFGTSKVNP